MSRWWPKPRGFGKLVLLECSDTSLRRRQHEAVILPTLPTPRCCKSSLWLSGPSGPALRSGGAVKQLRNSWPRSSELACCLVPLSLFPACATGRIQFLAFCHAAGNFPSVRQHLRQPGLCFASESSFPFLRVVWRTCRLQWAVPDHHICFVIDASDLKPFLLVSIGREP